MKELVSIGVLIKKHRVPDYAIRRLAKAGLITAYKQPRESWHRRDSYLFDEAEVARALGLPE